MSTLRPPYWYQFGNTVFHLYKDEQEAGYSQRMSSPETKVGLLNSWKEIASYLGRGVRTAQRWEQIGLPVHRIGKGQRAPVWADTRDIDAWFQTTGDKTNVPKPRLSVSNLIHESRFDALRKSMQEARFLRMQSAILRSHVKASRDCLVQAIRQMGHSDAPALELQMTKAVVGSYRPALQVSVN